MAAGRRETIPRLRLPAVARGATVAVVSPCSYPQAERLAQGLEGLRSLGFEPSVGKHALSKANRYFAGSATERLSDLHGAFLDPEVRAIFCSRGGYGSNYLLEGLDLDLIRAHPKPLLGYSDLTGIQTWLLDRVGLPAFSAPMVAADFRSPEGVDRASLSAALSGERWILGPEAGLRVLRPGRAQGELYGGCLTLLAAALGTPYAPQSEGKLLFVEDLAVKPYQVDRLLRQMILAGKFDGVVGIVFGEMMDCLTPEQDPRILDETILRVLERVEGPIGIGLRSGHVSHGNVTLAFGMQAELNLEREPKLAFLEPATEN
ncbi:MAG TPA: LD-carboxypeptidase [Acidobacteriaceae bacterium]|jgi:muramoyltetrapeptide carboxypeptidase|nr:LD-carboxypeptidase [Acidobacteriaceae bacterium]